MAKGNCIWNILQLVQKCLCKDYTITPSSSGSNPLKSVLDWFSVRKAFKHPDSGEVSVTDL